MGHHFLRVKLQPLQNETMITNLDGTESTSGSGSARATGAAEREVDEVPLGGTGAKAREVRARPADDQAGPVRRDRAVEK